MNDKKIGILDNYYFNVEKQELENDVERIVREGQAQMQEDAKETELNTQAINELKEEGIENPTPEQIKMAITPLIK